jgi:hypothetical protein
MMIELFTGMLEFICKKVIIKQKKKLHKGAPAKVAQG